MRLKAMRPTAPSKYVWIIGLVLGILGITGHFVTIDFLSRYSFAFLLAGFILLAVGTTFRDF
jgi:hypothetical protein